MSPGPYPSYKPSSAPWLGDVPEHWDLVQLGRIGRISKGNGGTKEDETPEGIPCIRYGDLYTSHKFHIMGSRTFVTEAKALEYTPIHRGDILLAGSGETIEEIGKSAVNLIESPACCGGDVVLFRPDIEMDARFSGYAVDCPQSQYQKSCMGRGITVMHIYGDELKYLWLTLPSLPEQHAIVRYLNHADRRIRRYISAKRKLLRLLEEERKIATLEAIQSPNAMARRLEVVADLVQRPIKRASDATYIPIGLYNRGRGMFRKEPRCGNDLGDSNFFWIEEGDLIISGQFAWEGAVALASDVEHGCVASHRYPILRGKPGILESGFLLGFFQTDWGQLLLDDNSRGAAGRNRPLNARALMKEKISLPPIETQLRIVGMLQFESHVRQQARLSEQLLKEYRTRLIADVVTGKLDVREAAALLPDDLEDEDPIDEGSPLAEDTYEDSHDPDLAAEELAMESEVTV